MSIFDDFYMLTAGIIFIDALAALYFLRRVLFDGAMIKVKD